jgi:glycosyltransferase involved in cell wall biosynthesis
LLVTLSRCQRLLPTMQHEFALCFDGRLMEELKTTGAIIHLLGGVRASRPMSVWKARRRFRMLLRDRRPDIVVCHSSWAHAVFANAVRQEDRPLASWLHGPISGRHWTERWAWLTPPDLAICNSDYTKASVLRLWPNVRQEVLYYLVEKPTCDYSQSELAAIRAELGTPLNSTVIIQVSRMEEWKGHLLHLEALGLLRETPGWVCWMVGGAQRPSEALYEKKLHRAADRLGITDRLRFLGQRTDVPRLLAAADIHCQPNTGPEPFGITFIEAMYAQLPVVTTAIGGAREIFGESYSFLIPSGDVQALAATLRRLIDDPHERKKLSISGLNRARKLCDPADQLNRLQKLLKACVSRVSHLTPP